MKFTKIFRYIFLAAIVALALWKLAPHFEDFGRFWELKNSIHYFWLTVTILSQVVQYVGDGWLSQILLHVMDVRVKMRDSFRIAALNVFAAHLLPIGEAGGLAAAYGFYKKLGVTTHQFIFLTICWSIITHAVLFSLLIVPVFFIGDLSFQLDQKMAIGLIVVTMIIAVIYIMRKAIGTRLDKLLGKYNWFKEVKTFFENGSDYKRLVLGNPWAMVKAFLAAFTYYACNAATLAFSFLTFGVVPDIFLVCFAYSASLLAGRVTLAPAGIGATEATLSLVFLEAGVDPPLAIGVIIVYRLISFWLPIPAGALSYYSLRKESKRK